MFVTTVIINCHSLNYDIFNANMTLFEMSLSWQLDSWLWRGRVSLMHTPSTKVLPNIFLQWDMLEKI